MSSTTRAIPSDWRIETLADLGGKVTSGSRGWAAHYADHGSLFVRITNLDRSNIRIDLKSSRFVQVDPNEAEARRTRLAAGDLLISITADIGIIGYVDEQVPDPAYINQHIARVRLDSGRANSRFVAYYLSSWEPQRRFVGSTDTGAKAGMNLATVAALSTVVPPLPEQSRIAIALADVDNLIGTLERVIAKKQAIKQGMMQQLLTGRTRLPGFTNPWQTSTVGAVGDVKTGPFGSALHERDYVPWGAPIITVEHLGEYGVNAGGAPMVSDADRHRLRAYVLMEGDIVFSRVGSIDRNARISSRESGWLFSGRLLRVRFNPAAADSKFMSAQFHSKRFTDSVRAVAVGQTMPSLNTSILKGIEIVLPSVDEQRAIGELAEGLDQELQRLGVRLEKARCIKQGMMQQLLTGRTRLPVQEAVA